MAKMIPETVEDFHGSYGERKVYNALKNNLPNEYTVFHSLGWNDRNEKGNIEWGEVDFTVFHPDKGILVIEVKAGGISLQDGKWVQQRLDDQRSFPMKDPLEQANRSKYRISKELSRVLSGSDHCWSESAVWFPSVEGRNQIGNMPLTYHSEIVFFKDTLASPQKAIDKAFSFYNMERRTMLSAEGKRKLLFALAPSFQLVPGLRGLYEEQEALFHRMTTEQSKVLDYLEEQQTAAIHGIAGTGKTLLAVEKARRLAENGEVLFLCFNRLLMEDLREYSAYDNVTYYNLHSLVKAKMAVDRMPTEEDILNYLNNYDQYDWTFNHIIIDEGQDFFEEHMNLLSTIAAMNEGCFYVFYDKNQLVQQEELPSWQKEAECRLVLHRNCRNTHCIASTATKPIEVEPKMWEGAPKGLVPEFHIAPTQEAFLSTLEKIIQKYTKSGIPLRDITVLSVKSESASALNGVDHIGKWPLSRRRGESDAVFFSTAIKYKGLEAPVIILIDVDSSTFENQRNKSRFYVGTSRAKDFLEFVTLLNDDGVQALAESLIEEENSEGLKSVCSVLHVQVSED